MTDRERLMREVARIMGDHYALMLEDVRIGDGIIGARHAQSGSVWALMSDMLYCRVGPPGTPIIQWPPEVRQAWYMMRRRYEHHLT